MTKPAYQALSQWFCNSLPNTVNKALPARIRTDRCFRASGLRSWRFSLCWRFAYCCGDHLQGRANVILSKQTQTFKTQPTTLWKYFGKVLISTTIKSGILSKEIHFLRHYIELTIIIDTFYILDTLYIFGHQLSISAILINKTSLEYFWLTNKYCRIK